MVLVLDVELVDDVELVVLVLLVEELEAMCIEQIRIKILFSSALKDTGGRGGSCCRHTSRG